MSPATNEWVGKAETDYAVISALLQASAVASLWEPICFHSQQCVEKYFKARLVEAGVAFPKTHDFAYLLPAVLAVEPGWSRYGNRVLTLNTWAVAVRYPGPAANRMEAAHGGTPVPDLAGGGSHRLGTLNRTRRRV